MIVCLPTNTSIVYNTGYYFKIIFFPHQIHTHVSIKTNWSVQTNLPVDITQILDLGLTEDTQSHACICNNISY